MKRTYFLWMALCLSIFISGCMFGELGMYGKEREDYLKSIKPYLQYWDKPGMTPEGRRGDSKECGAGNTDYVGFLGSPSLKTLQRPGETERQTETRLMHDWVGCMKQKGYRHENDLTPRK